MNVHSLASVGIPAPTGLAALRRPASAVPQTEAEAKTARLRDAATQFESLFLSLIVKEMTDGLPGLFGEGAGSEIYRGLFQTSLGSALAGKGFGLAQSIEQSLVPHDPKVPSARVPATSAIAPAPAPPLRSIVRGHQS